MRARPRHARNALVGLSDRPVGAARCSAYVLVSLHPGQVVVTAASWTEIARGVAAVVQILAIVVAGAWAYYKFVRGRTFKPRAELDLDAHILEVEDEKAISLNVDFHNTGSIRIEFPRDDDPGRLLQVEVRGTDATTPEPTPTGETSSSSLTFSRARTDAKSGRRSGITCVSFRSGARAGPHAVAGVSDRGRGRQPEASRAYGTTETVESDTRAFRTHAIAIPRAGRGPSRRPLRGSRAGTARGRRSRAGSPTRPRRCAGARTSR